MMSLPTAMRCLPRPLRLSGEDAIMLAAMTIGDRTYLAYSAQALSAPALSTCSWSPACIWPLSPDAFPG